MVLTASTATLSELLREEEEGEQLRDGVDLRVSIAKLERAARCRYA